MSRYFCTVGLLLMTLVFVSCNKELKNERIITGDWEVKEVKYDGVDYIDRIDSIGLLKYSFTYIFSKDSGFVFTSGNNFVGAKWYFGPGEKAIFFEEIDTIHSVYKQRITNSFIPLFVDSISMNISYDEVTGLYDTLIENKEVWQVKFEGKKEIILSNDYNEHLYTVTLEKVKNFSLDRKE